MNSIRPAANSRRHLVFWAGIVAVSAGVALHMPMYFDAAEMGYMMVGMPMSAGMKAGMGLILLGIAAAAYGLLPRRGEADRAVVANVAVRAMDDAPFRPAHVALLLVMAAAVTIDVMKPTTLAFVLPGVAAEYDLRSPLNPDGGLPVVWLPLCALLGMVIGSIAWGWLGDRIGRRASILLAGVMFIATSICGAMPEFGWNLLMCFLMGAAVGGMLPIAFALLAETIPARHRSWLMVLIGGDVAGAYVLTSALSAQLQPTFGWRIMWLIGLPSGVALILLNRWIPESPRFLLATGQVARAEAVMRRFGARLVPIPAGEPAATQVDLGFRGLFRHPFSGLTAGVVLFALGWGLVNNGFLLWLPTNLRNLGLDVGTADRLLANSALIGFPAIFLVAALYGFWSSKKTMIVAAVLTASALTVFAVMGTGIAANPVLLQVLIVVLLAGTSAMLAMITPYSSEIYPTMVRARGAGLAGMSGRLGGFLGVGVVLAGLAPPSLAGAATLGAVPIGFAALAVTRYGLETRRRRLEEIAAPQWLNQAAADGVHATVDYLVIGAGPAGLQLGDFLQRSGREYLILEAGSAPGTFFRTFPRHRRLISINKPHTGEHDPERNLRMDWNSLLSDDPALLFTRYSERYFPAAEDMVRYLGDFAAARQLRVQYDTTVVRVDRAGPDGGGGFVVTDVEGRIYHARRLIVATGPARPNVPAIPGIETVELYGTVSVEPRDFLDQRVLIIGKGNSAFETADNLVETAAVIHVAGRSSIRMSWQTHYVGHLRAVNNNFLDTYQLKSQNALLDGEIRHIERTDDGYLVSFSFSRADEFVKELRYDRVILCTGFRFDDSIFATGCRPELVIDDRFPAQTPRWRSTNVDHLFFAGTLMQVRDFKTSTSGFIHGFRYCVRSLHRILEHTYHGVEWPHREVPADAAQLTSMVIDRVNRSSALWQQFGVLADLIVVGGEVARYYEELPPDHVHDGGFGDPGSYFLVTLEYGPDHDRIDPFDISAGRIAQTDAARAEQGRYLHPVVRHYVGRRLAATHHMAENLENDWTSATVHREPLQAFIARQLAGEPAKDAVEVPV